MGTCSSTAGGKNLGFSSEEQQFGGKLALYSVLALPVKHQHFAAAFAFAALPSLGEQPQQHHIIHLSIHPSSPLWVPCPSDVSKAVENTPEKPSA